MIGIEVVGLKAVLQSIDKLNKDKIKKFKHVGVVGVRDILKHFRESQGQAGKWQKSLRGGKPLQKTGALQQSITEHIHSDDRVEVGTNIKYGRIHNFGGVIKPKTKKYLSFPIGQSWVKVKKVDMPQREFLWLSREADSNMTKVLTDSWRELTK